MGARSNITGDVLGSGVRFNEMSGRASGEMMNEMLQTVDHQQKKKSDPVKTHLSGCVLDVFICTAVDGTAINRTESGSGVLIAADNSCSRRSVSATELPPGPRLTSGSFKLTPLAGLVVDCG
jgi:hypothetical protein